MEDDGLRWFTWGHQMMHENKHFGKIAIMAGATSEDEGCEIEGPGAIRAEVGA